MLRKKSVRVGVGRSIAVGRPRHGEQQMTSQIVDNLACRIEAEAVLDAATTVEVVAALAKLLPNAAGSRALRPEDLRSTEFVLHLIDRALPGWSIHLGGMALEPNGHWTCNLRTHETGDSDEFIGFGKGMGVANALLAALLRTLAYLEGRSVMP